jgi:uncharacterized protein
MTAEDMVDASLAGLDRSNHNSSPARHQRLGVFEAAQKALGPNLSRQKLAARYGIGG